MEDRLPLYEDMTRLIFIRHGQSVANAEDKFAGQTNVDLTEKGYAQAECAAKYLTAHEKIDKIYSSDLIRAHNTALPTAKLLGLDIIDTKGLREICAGKWEGMRVSEITQKYEQEFYVWSNDFANAQCPGGESVKDVYYRIVDEVKKIARKNDGLNLLLATHATPIRVVKCYSQGFDWDGMTKIHFVKNASINIFEYDPESEKITLIAQDIVDHLDPKMVTLVPKGLEN